MCRFSLDHPYRPTCNKLCDLHRRPKFELLCDEARARGQRRHCDPTAQNTEIRLSVGQINDCSDCASDPSTFKFGRDSESTGYTHLGESRAANFDSQNAFVDREGSAGIGASPHGYHQPRAFDNPVPVGRYKPPQAVDRASIGDQHAADLGRYEQEKGKRSREIASQKANRAYRPRDPRYLYPKETPDDQRIVISSDEGEKKLDPLKKYPSKARRRPLDAKIQEQLRKERQDVLEMDEAFRKQYFETFLKPEQEKRALKDFGSQWNVGRDR